MRYEIELKNITKRYDNKTILDNISISLNNEHVYVLMRSYLVAKRKKYQLGR